MMGRHWWIVVVATDIVVEQGPAGTGRNSEAKGECVAGRAHILEEHRWPEIEGVYHSVPVVVDVEGQWALVRVEQIANRTRVDELDCTGHVIVM